MTKPSEIRAALRHYVTKSLTELCNDKPDETDRAYYPTTADIRNHVWKAKQAMKFSKIDQENLQLLIEKWKILIQNQSSILDHTEKLSRLRNNSESASLTVIASN
eukprot:m.293002 g.293002  ORF g.293002 m.293002 type:complete len:105 (+) comp40735_c0_seq11:694-1008(+)